tara:strand:+ start:260 stop:940 length:681 start_codon:yes stop_codon:yes gene_type:complete
MLEYIKKSLDEQPAIKKDLYLHSVPVQALHPFTNNIDFASVIAKVEQLIPQRLLNNVDVIYVANLKNFNRKDRNFNAMYKDGAIYISPDQDDAKDLLDDIIHEIAHSFEREYQDMIYGDGNLEREFLAKRRSLYYLIDNKNINILNYNNAEYNAKFDDHLYHDVGYDKLRTISSGLFYSPYAITSLREYWANGFENYLLGDRERLKDLCPVLCSKIFYVLEDKEQN